MLQKYPPSRKVHIPLYTPNFISAREYFISLCTRQRVPHSRELHVPLYSWKKHPSPREQRTALDKPKNTLAREVRGIVICTHPLVLMRRRGRWEGLKRRLMRIRMGMGVRGRMRVGRVRRRRWPLIEVRIILIHHLGTAHHPARARHPRAGLPTCVPERRTTRSYTIPCFHSVHSPPTPLASPWLAPLLDRSFGRSSNTT